MSKQCSLSEKFNLSSVNAKNFSNRNVEKKILTSVHRICLTKKQRKKTRTRKIRQLSPYWL